MQEVRFLHAGTYCKGMVDIKLVIGKVRMFSVGLFFWVQANCVFLLVPPPMIVSATESVSCAF